jgi:hypothetical protein
MARAKTLNDVQQRAVADLKKDGICILQFSDLFPRQRLQDCTEVAENVVVANRARIENQRRTLTRDRQKYYYLSLWDGFIDLDNPFIKITLSDQLLGIVNHYFGVAGRLVNVDYWYHLPMPGDDVASQNWHRDPSDRKLAKIFFYLRDVDDTSGPFQYVLGSHDTGRFGKVFPRRLPHGTYPPRGAVERTFPPESRVACTGKAGTIVICDTSGLHRGGHVTARDRFLFYAFYVTDGNYDLRYYKQASAYRVKNAMPLNAEAEFALGLWK